MLEEFENAALFLRLGLPSTLIRHENGAFRKRSSNRLCILVWTESILKTKLFENDEVNLVPRVSHLTAHEVAMRLR